jgi:hypothetical protein
LYPSCWRYRFPPLERWVLLPWPCYSCLSDSFVFDSDPKCPRECVHSYPGMDFSGVIKSLNQALVCWSQFFGHFFQKLHTDTLGLSFFHIGIRRVVVICFKSDLFSSGYRTRNQRTDEVGKNMVCHQTLQNELGSTSVTFEFCSKRSDL